MGALDISEAPSFADRLKVRLGVAVGVWSEGDKKLFDQIGLSFALISALLITTDYFIQFAVMESGLLKGETEGLSLFSQYNPHGIFIALEDLGYLMMGVAFLFTAAVFAGRNKLELTIRWLFAIGSVGAIGSLISLSLLYGADLEYRFEMSVLSIDWTVLIGSGALLSILFKRSGYHRLTS